MLNIYDIMKEHLRIFSFIVVDKDLGDITCQKQYLYCKKNTFHLKKLQGQGKEFKLQ